MKTRLSLISVVIGLVWLATCILSPAETLRPISASGTTGVTASGNSFAPAFGGDARLVAFVSQAKNLATNQSSGPYLDIFVRNPGASNTVLVSVAISGIGGGDGNSTSPSLSSNGQFVVFASEAGNLVNNDTNEAADIFVRDLVAGVTTLASPASGGGAAAGLPYAYANAPMCGNPIISADGHSVVFESFATNLISLQDTNQASDVFARDLQNATTILVSLNSTGAGSGNGSSDSPSMSADGNVVAFVSTSTDLAPSATNQAPEIYVRNLQAQTTIWASIGVDQFFPHDVNLRCAHPVLSADGHSVAFKAENLAFPGVAYLVHYDLETGLTTGLTNNTSMATEPQLSADGRFVAAESSTDVYRWDVLTGSNTLVSIDLAGDGPGSSASHNPAMSLDGQRVVFLSAATNLTANASNGESQVYLRDLASGVTRLASISLAGSASSIGNNVTGPVISPDGRWVAFESLAPDLVPGDSNQAQDVFLRDLEAGSTQAVSQRPSLLVPATAPALSTAAPKGLSADGRIVAFVSFDSDLVAGDTNQYPDIFVRDLIAGTVLPAGLMALDTFPSYQVPLSPAISPDGRYVAFSRRSSCIVDNCGKPDVFRTDFLDGSTLLVSLRADGAQAGNLGSLAPAISSDGNLVAFQSAATDLMIDASSGPGGIFLRDMTGGTNSKVSVNLLNNAYDPGISFNPAFSPDDRWIVFASQSTLLTTNKNISLFGPPFTNLFARDLLSLTTRMVSVTPDGASGLGYSHGAVFSANSRYVAYVTFSNSLALYDFFVGTGKLLCDQCDNPSLSADGRFVGYDTVAAGSSAEDIFLQDLLSGTTNLISVNRLGSGGGNDNSAAPLISYDGRWVVFASKASNLVDNDTNGASDIFLRDRVLGTTLLISMNLSGTGSGNGPSTQPILSADGHTVVFQSFASDLVPGDYNDRRDVFVLRLGGPDSDHDGMDDDWEMAYFGTLARDGTGDFDGDGHTDLAEFQAGTDPTDRGSVLRALTLSPAAGGAARVIWSASPGKRYQVQYRDKAEAGEWQTLPSIVVAAGTSASLADNSIAGVSHRFYRVSLLK